MSLFKHHSKILLSWMHKIPLTLKDTSTITSFIMQHWLHRYMGIHIMMASVLNIHLSFVPLGWKFPELHQLQNLPPKWTTDLCLLVVFVTHVTALNVLCEASSLLWTLFPPSGCMCVRGWLCILLSPLFLVAVTLHGFLRGYRGRTVVITVLCGSNVAEV